ncbi:hypothetical protein HD554DRAFT_220116 [Boletus coccyginus]|nr:hypothetical protein HD554DRAFT_220116 [Boletus coccyginus]
MRLYPFRYTRGQVTSSVPTQEPASAPVGTKEPAINEMRKKFDATQPEVLNETYARTAFPSTEEYGGLARKPNRRSKILRWEKPPKPGLVPSAALSEPQTSRQVASPAPSRPHQPFSISSQPEGIRHSSYGSNRSLTKPDTHRSDVGLIEPSTTGYGPRSLHPRQTADGVVSFPIC